MGTGPSRTEVVTVCVVRIKKTKWILEATFLKEERSWQNSLLGIFAKEREKKKKNGRVPQNYISDLNLYSCKH